MDTPDTREQGLQTPLSSVELAIGGLLLSGRTKKGVAQDLGMSFGQVEYRIWTLMKRLKAKNLHHLTALLARWPQFEDANDSVLQRD